MDDSTRPSPNHRATEGPQSALVGAPWVAVPVDLVGAVSDAALAVWVAVAAHASSRTAAAWPGVPLLAVESGRSERSVQRALRELEAAGWLSTTPSRRPDGSSGSNTYRLVRPYTFQRPQPVDNPVGDRPGEPEGVTEVSGGW